MLKFCCPVDKELHFFAHKPWGMTGMFMKKVQGFTLIELLIVIAIIAILASLSYPSYQSYIIQTRRSDAQTELIKAQLKQSSLHILNSYTNIETSIGLPIDAPYYSFSIVSAGTITYLMKAVAKSGGSQKNDDISCQILFTDQNNHHTSDGSKSNEQCW